MGYTALYRKYRPKTFDEVAGQKSIIKTLKNAVKKDRIAHAYLFCGPRGTGKTSTAKIFARAINCTGDSILCGNCNNCQAALENDHPDIIEIDAASNNGVEEVRNLIEKVKYAPIQGKYKIYIIDEVHMMSKSAYNALLKTIEEPPKHVIFIFATTEPHKVLPTILSRCQRYDFKKVPKSEMINRMKEICSKENIVISDDALNVIANLSDGGMRDALSVLDQCYAYSGDNIAVADVLEAYGIVSIKEQVQLLIDIIDKNTAKVINKIVEFNSRGVDIKRLTSSLIDILKAKIISDMTKEIHQPLDDENYAKLISKESIKESLNKVDTLMETYSKYQFASDDESYFQIACIKMMQANKENNHVNKIDSTKDKSVMKSDSDKKVVIDSYQKSDEEKKCETLNVSRETGIKNYFDDYIQMTDNEYLSLLVGADKENKRKDMECFKNNNLYCRDIELGKYANLMKNTKIIASAINYIVVSVENKAVENQINSCNQNNEFNNYTKDVLGKIKKVFAIENSRVNNLLALFREKMSKNDLPEPMKIDISENNNDNIDKIKDIFGDNVIVEE